MSLTAERRQPPSPTTHPDPSGDRFVGWALLTTTGLLVSLQLLAGHVIPPLAIFGAILGLLGVATLRRRARWLLVIDAIAAGAYLVGSVPFFAANLAHPESPVSFLAEVFLLLALLTVVTGVVMRLRGVGARARRRTVVGAIGMACVATVVSLVAAAGVVAEARQDGDVPLVSERSTFPERIEVPAGAAVLWLDNKDPFHHTFLIDGTEVREVLAAGSSVRVPIELDPGSYRFWCDVPGHESMEGVLDVR